VSAIYYGQMRKVHDNYASDALWEIHNVVCDIVAKLYLHDEWSFVFVPREANSLAHMLALWALPVTSSRPVDISSIPSWGRGDVEL